MYKEKRLLRERNTIYKYKYSISRVKEKQYMKLQALI
jgi:hypothetical protein